MSRQLLKEIEITEMKGLRIGNVQNDEAQTGVTVLLFDQGAKAGVVLVAAVRHPEKHHWRHL